MVYFLSLPYMNACNDGARCALGVRGPRRLNSAWYTSAKCLSTPSPAALLKVSEQTILLRIRPASERGIVCSTRVFAGSNSPVKRQVCVIVTDAVLGLIVSYGMR